MADETQTPEPVTEVVPEVAPEVTPTPEPAAPAAPVKKTKEPKLASNQRILLSGNVYTAN